MISHPAPVTGYEDCPTQITNNKKRRMKTFKLIFITPFVFAYVVAAAPVPADVVDVYDGNTTTVKYESGEKAKVRLIGIDMKPSPRKAPVENARRNLAAGTAGSTAGNPKEGTR